MNKQLNMPRHVAIIMDGNGRWAKKRFLPRVAGHRAGAKTVRRAVDYCLKNGIEVLSLFALSVENFLSRPKSEVGFLVDLFSETLKKHVDELNSNNVRVLVIGDPSVFPASLQRQIEAAMSLTKDNTALTLVVAANYSGRWDLIQTAKKIAIAHQNGDVDVTSLNEKMFSSYLATDGLMEPDLLIRTSGEQRISNFMLWQFAYTELYFSPLFWPEFDADEFDRAIEIFRARERRFGLTSDQITRRGDTIAH